MQGIVAPSNKENATRLVPLVPPGTMWLCAWGGGLLELVWILVDSNRFAHALFDFAPHGPFPYLALLLGRTAGLALLVQLSFRLVRGEVPPLIAASIVTLALNMVVALKVGPLRPLLISGTVMAQILIALAGLRREAAAPAATGPASVPPRQPES